MEVHAQDPLAVVVFNRLAVRCATMIDPAGGVPAGARINAVAAVTVTQRKQKGVERVFGVDGMLASCCRVGNARPLYSMMRMPRGMSATAKTPLPWMGLRRIWIRRGMNAGMYAVKQTQV